MGTSKTPVELVRKIKDHAAVMGEDNSYAVKEASKVYKATILDGLRKEVGNDFKLSHWRWIPSPDGGGNYKGLKLGVGYDVKGKINATSFIKARPPGPWKVLEYGAAAHRVAPRAKGRRTKLRFGSSPTFPTEVRTRQTRAKRVWSRAARIGERRAMDVFTAVRRREFVKGW